VHAELPRLHSVLFFLRHFGLSAFVAAEEAAGRSGNAAGEVCVFVLTRTYDIRTFQTRLSFFLFSREYGVYMECID